MVAPQFHTALSNAHVAATRCIAGPAPAVKVASYSGKHGGNRAVYPYTPVHWKARVCILATLGTCFPVFQLEFSNMVMASLALLNRVISVGIIFCKGAVRLQ